MHVSERRCAVVYNPIKVSDELRDAISSAGHGARAGPTRSGWKPPPMTQPANDGRSDLGSR